GGIPGPGPGGGLPALEDPGQQWGETGGDVELVASSARLGGGRLRELREAGAEGVETHAPHGDQGGYHAAEATPLGQDQAEAVEGPDGGLGPREIGKGRADRIGPAVQWLRTWQERTLQDQGGCCPTVTRSESRASPTCYQACASPTPYL